RRTVASASEDGLEFLQIGNRFQIRGALLSSKSAVQIAANADVPAVAGQLTDMIDVIHDIRQRDRLARRLPALPAGIEHPGIQSCADHRITLNEKFDLLIRESAITRNQRAAAIVTGQDRAGTAVDGLKETCVTAMGEVDAH